MLMDCIGLGTGTSQIKSFSFYWSKLIKETWKRPKRNMGTTMDFCQAIDKAFKTAPPAESRHLRLIERTVLEVLASVTSTFNKHGPGIIVSAYILGETEKAKEGESERQEVGTKNHTD